MRKSSSAASNWLRAKGHELHAMAELLPVDWMASIRPKGTSRPMVEVSPTSEPGRCHEMTYDDDFILLRTASGPRRIFCEKLGVSWPPPEKLDFLGFPFVRERMSEITDEQRADMTHVCRGAEYFPLSDAGDAK